MKLTVISHTQYHRRGDGTLVGWGPTVRELDHLATLFDEIRHVAWLYDGPAPASGLPHEARNLRVIPVPPSGGPGWRRKLGILGRSVGYLRTIHDALRGADAVHVRCPANISLMAIVLLATCDRPRYRWVKYAGNWKPGTRDSLAYRFQRWWLTRNLHRGVVTINGSWPDQPAHVVTFPNPSLTTEDLANGRAAALRKSVGAGGALRLVTVGRVDEPKGTPIAVRVIAGLLERGIDAHLDVVGDGPALDDCRTLARELAVESRISFHGWVPHQRVQSFMADTHAILLPTSASEGWPKVLSEAMAAGTVPLTTTVSSIPGILRETGAGVALPRDPAAFVDEMCRWIADPALWLAMRDHSVAAAPAFTYDAYLERVRKLFNASWSIALATRSQATPA